MHGEYKSEPRSKGGGHKVIIEDLYEDLEDNNNLGIDSSELLIDAGTPESPEGSGSGTGPREPPRQAWEELSRSDEGGGGASYGVLGGRSVMLPSTNRAAAAKPASVEDLTDLSAGMASDDFILEEDTWYDALEEQDTSPPDVAKQLLTHLLTRATLLTSKHLLERATAVTDIWQQVSGIYTDKQLTAFAKVERLAQLLRQQQHIVPSDWREVIRQVLEGFELIHELQRISLGDEAKTVERVKRGIVQLQRLLDQPLVKRTLPQSVQQTLSASLPPILQTIASLQAFAALPESAPFEDYLDVVKRVLTDRQMGGDLAPRVLIESITRVEQLFLQVKDVLTSVSTGVHEVGELQASFLGLDASFDLKMAWLSQVMDTPSLLAVLRRQLSPETLTLLQQILPWLRQLNSYPADSALGQQAAWLLQQLNDPAAQALIQQSPLQPVIEQIKQQFAGDSTSLALFQALLQLTDPNQSVRQKLQRLIAPLVSRQSLGQAIRGAISYGTGYGPVLDVWDWYWRQPSGLSWEETLNRFIEELQAHPEHLTQLLPPSLQSAAKTVGWLRQFPRGGSWQKTLQWAAKSAQEVPQLQWLYNRFIELSLAKAVYGALQHTERSVQEEALGQVAQDLGQYWPGLAETGGGLLTAMIPLLPGLLGISRDIYCLPPADSWLEWINHVMRIIQKTDSPALQQLGQQLESMIANRFVEGLSAGLDSASEAASNAWSSIGTAVQSSTEAMSAAGSSITAITSKVSEAIANIKDPLVFPGAEATPISITSGHIMQALNSGDAEKAWELYASASEANQKSLHEDPGIADFIEGRKISAEPDVELSTAMQETPERREHPVVVSKLLEGPQIEAAGGANTSVEESEKFELLDIEALLSEKGSFIGTGLKVASGLGLALLVGAAYLTWKVRRAAIAKSAVDSASERKGEGEGLVRDLKPDVEQALETETTPALSDKDSSGGSNLNEVRVQNSKINTLNRYKVPLLMGMGGGGLLAAAAIYFYSASKAISEDPALTADLGFTPEEMDIILNVDSLVHNESSLSELHRQKRAVEVEEEEEEEEEWKTRNPDGSKIHEYYTNLNNPNGYVMFDMAVLARGILRHSRLSGNHISYGKFLILMDRYLDAQLAKHYKDFSFESRVPGILIEKAKVGELLASSNDPDVVNFLKNNTSQVWEELKIDADVVLASLYSETLNSTSSDTELFYKVLNRMHPMANIGQVVTPAEGDNVIIKECVEYISRMNDRFQRRLYRLVDFSKNTDLKPQFTADMQARTEHIEMSWRQMLIKHEARDAYTPEQEKELRVLEVAKLYNSELMAGRRRLIEVSSLLNLRGLKSVETKNDYRDILFAQSRARALLHKKNGTQAPRNKSVFDKPPTAQDQAFIALAEAVIYAIIANKDKQRRDPSYPYRLLNYLELDYLETLNPLQLMNDYTEAKTRLSAELFVDEGDRPEGFKTLTDVKRRNDIAESDRGCRSRWVYNPMIRGYREFTQCDNTIDQAYNKQFSDYRSKFSDYQSKVFANAALLITGLPAKYLAHPVKKVRNYHVVGDLRRGRYQLPGTLTFIQLFDNSVVVVSTLCGELSIRCVNYLISGPLYNEILEKPLDYGRSNNYQIDHYLESFEFFFEYGLGAPSVVKSAIDKSPVLMRNYYLSTNKESDLSGFSDGNKLSVVVAAAAKFGLDNISKVLRDSYEDLTEAEQLLFMLPAVRQLHRKINDESYSMDWPRLVLEFVDLIMMVVSVGVGSAASIKKLGTRIQASIAKYQAQGLRSIGLWRAVMKEVPELFGRAAGSIAKTLAEEMIELVQPFPITGLLRSINSGIQQGALGPHAVAAMSYKFTGDFISNTENLTSGRLNSNWAVSDINTSTAKSGAIDTRFNNTYCIDGKYYIEQNGKTYSIIWDSTNDTWRLVNPEHPGRFAYAAPVKLIGGEWRTHLNLAAKGGGRDRLTVLLSGTTKYIKNQLESAASQLSKGDHSKALAYVKKAWGEAKQSNDIETRDSIMKKAEEILSNYFGIGIEVPSIKDLQSRFDKKANEVPLTEIDNVANFIESTHLLLEDFDPTRISRNDFGLLVRMHEAVTTLPTQEIDTNYRNREPIASGSICKVYEYNQDYVVKDYTSVVTAERQGRMLKARNNEAAFRRLYGEDTATVWVFPTKNPLETQVSIKLKRIPGEALDALIAKDDPSVIAELTREADFDKVINELVDTLVNNGIVHNDLNLGNIMYDSKTKTFKLIDFDDADIKPVGEKLTDTQATTMRNKLKYVFGDFDRQIRDRLRSEQTRLGAPSTLLNHAQLEELATERKRYLTQVEALKRRKPNDFNRGKLGYETIEIDGVDKDLSELELTKFFNNPPRSLNAEQRGVMSGLIESARGKRIIQTSISVAAKYREALKLGSTQMIMAPQGFLLTAADATEVGRCMPLVLSLAVALKNENAKTFFDNLYRAAAQTGASQMIPALDVLHGTSIQAHLKPIKFAADSEGTVNAIVDTVDGATGTKLFSMDSQNHAMMVGVTVDTQAVKTFHFYDPNIGLSSYSSANDLKKAMRQTVGTKEMGDQYVAYGSGEPKYRLSEINTGALENVDLQLQGSAAGVKLTVRELSDRHLARR
ncbi:Phosphotransferase enzyme family protein [Pseudomonas sp. LAMO17WK12:I10]|uniref:OspG family effector kinase n=1 Tax=unclassified Pseudomonas TaxID=196821 RepID=UPI000BDD3362|nr:MULTISPECIES: phosphotransferase [unclassified Pseudomonas]PXX59082.1 phosphotransferase family enzyme [Pseudomonas sp. LAMO17WK12:I9]SNY48383.1 Phosphotransferase enzyme family protein [Pseudomonas sp. LAMO17WK12:I10]